MDKPQKTAVRAAERRLPTVAIVGRPNVGKSSLFNAVVGRRLAIVHEMPGVTRDRVVEPVTVDGRRFLLIDTGGLGTMRGETRNVDVWDERIAEQVDVAVEGADVLICVGNVQDGLTPLDEEVAKRLRAAGKPVVYAVNKCDNPEFEAEAVDFARLGFEHVYPISCTHRKRLDSLMSGALRLLPAPSAPEAAEDGSATPETEPEKPFSIAVIGRPNVGKSSLVNALLGEERVIVSDVAGTTRDAIDVDIVLKTGDTERPAVLVDTAGLRKHTKVDTVVELFSTMRAKTAISRADLVLFVVEADPDGVTAQDRRISTLIQAAAKACIVVANKFDLWSNACKKATLQSEMRRTLPGMEFAPVVPVSAKERRNLGELLDTLSGVAANLEVRIPTAVVNRVLGDAFAAKTPPMNGPAPLKLYYASMVGSAPPKFLLFVNDPKYCAPNYLAYLRNKLREAFNLVGLPLRLELRARPKKVLSFHTEGPARNPRRKLRKN